jgi:hypothetical protein
MEASMTGSRIEYVGPSELHDGHLLGFERAGDRVTVRVRGADGRDLALEFTGVTDLTASHPEGMLLYGLAELGADGGGETRQFMFANWEEWDDSGLEIAAHGFRILPPSASSPS